VRHWHPELDAYVPGHVIDPEQLAVPLGGVPKVVAVDYGGTAPFCALWLARLAPRLVVVYRELYTAGLTPRQQALAILGAEAPGERDPGRPIPVYIDPSTYARGANLPAAPPSGDPHTPPKGSIAWEYRAAGLPVRRANNNRRAGIAAIQDALLYGPDGLPGLFVYSTCRNLIRTLPDLQRDEKDPEVYDTDGEDHAADTLRYGLLALGPPPRPRPSSDQSPARIIVPRTMTGGLLRAPL
jgi:hypothetical protein